MRDPVCGMTVDPKTALSHVHAGTTYYFCNPRCREKFQKNPAAFLTTPEKPPKAGTGLYTCPMHPEIRQVGPGSCPICGMALDPVDISEDDLTHPELIDMRRRLWIALAFTVPLLAIAMTQMHPP